MHLNTTVLFAVLAEREKERERERERDVKEKSVQDRWEHCASVPPSPYEMNEK